MVNEIAKHRRPCLSRFGCIFPFGIYSWLAANAVQKGAPVTQLYPQASSQQLGFDGLYRDYANKLIRFKLTLIRDRQTLSRKAKNRNRLDFSASGDSFISFAPTSGTTSWARKRWQLSTACRLFSTCHAATGDACLWWDWNLLTASRTATSSLLLAAQNVCSSFA